MVISLEKWWCFFGEMCSSPWENDGVSLGRCVHLHGAMMVFPRGRWCFTCYSWGDVFMELPPQGLLFPWGHWLMDLCILYAISIWKCVVPPHSGFMMTRFGEEVVVWDTWHTSMGLQEEMDKYVTYLKNKWVGSCLNGAFTIPPTGPPLPRSRVCGMAFHSMQRKEDN